jgi:hypothetical protein
LLLLASEESEQKELEDWLSFPAQKYSMKEVPQIGTKPLLSFSSRWSL